MVIKLSMAVGTRGAPKIVYAAQHKGMQALKLYNERHEAATAELFSEAWPVTMLTQDAAALATFTAKGFQPAMVDGSLQMVLAEPLVAATANFVVSKRSQVCVALDGISVIRGGKLTKDATAKRKFAPAEVATAHSRAAKVDDKAAHLLVVTHWDTVRWERYVLTPEEVLQRVKDAYPEATIHLIMDSAGALPSASARTSVARTARFAKAELAKAATLAVAAADDATRSEILKATMTRVAAVSAAAKSSTTHLDELLRQEAIKQRDDAIARARETLLRVARENGWKMEHSHVTEKRTLGSYGGLFVLPRLEPLLTERYDEREDGYIVLYTKPTPDNANFDWLYSGGAENDNKWIRASKAHLIDRLKRSESGLPSRTEWYLTRFLAEFATLQSRYADLRFWEYFALCEKLPRTPSGYMLWCAKMGITYIDASGFVRQDGDPIDVAADADADADAEDCAVSAVRPAKRRRPDE